MVNVDFSPALLLGMSLIAGGLALYQLRRVQPDISRDFDVIVSAVATFSGGILIFQVGYDNPVSPIQVCLPACLDFAEAGLVEQHPHWKPEWTALQLRLMGVCIGCRGGGWIPSCYSASC